eukprot:jgi/Bigna1/143671/aug1.80_g18379
MVEETSSKVKKPPVQMTSALEVWKSYEGVFWGMNYRGDLRQDSDANPLKVVYRTEHQAVEVVAITQSHNISELLGRPLEQPINMRNRASPFIPEIDFYGQVDMSRVSVVHITNVDNPNEARNTNNTMLTTNTPNNIEPKGWGHADGRYSEDGKTNTLIPATKIHSGDKRVAR